MDVHVGEGDDAVDATVGDSVIIALPENGTTGYQWSVEPAGDKVVVETNTFLPPEDAAPGAAGRRVVTLRAISAGTANVGLRLQRAWETAATERREVAINVRD